MDSTSPGVGRLPEREEPLAETRSARAPAHPAGGGHRHAHAMTGRMLRLAFLLTILILLVEFAGGLLSNSLALLSDAGHMLTDVAALGLAWFATAQAERPANARKTYGYHRTGILAALANAATLLLIIVVIAFEAIQRFRHPEPVTPWVMFVAAAVGIGANLCIAFVLRGEGGDNLNVRAALLHILGDVGASVGVVVAGLIILLTGWYVVDPLISLFIAVLIAKGAWDILRETMDILMEATPRDVDVARLARDMREVAGVRAVHDLHVWTLGSGVRALSSHVVVDDLPPSASAPILDRLGEMLRRDYRIAHTTIQFESEAHEGHEGYCACPPGMEECLHCDPAPLDGHDHAGDSAHDRAHSHA